MASSLKNVTFGFTGAAEVEPNNLKDLLDDKFGFGPLVLDPKTRVKWPEWPEDIDAIDLAVPITEKQYTETVRMMLEWAEHVGINLTVFSDGSVDDRDDVFTDAKVIDAKNANMALIDYLVDERSKGHEVYLIVTWGENGDDHTEILVDLAHAAKIPVLALDRGLDDLEFKDTPEPEPEPEEERPRRGRRRSEPEEGTTDDAPDDRPRRGRARKTTETAPEPAETSSDESLETEVSRARMRAEKPADSPEDAGDVVMRALVDARRLVRSLDSCHAAMTRKEDIAPSALYQLIEEAIDTYRDQPAAAKKVGGRPRKDGTAAQPRTPAQRGVKEVWDDEAGSWKPAGRGRLPKDAKIRTVDPKTREVIEDDES
jgi:hypothetical protein